MKMLKKALVLTAIGIFIVFGAIGTILLLGIDGVNASSSNRRLTVIYADGFETNAVRVSRTVPLVRNDEGDRVTDGTTPLVSHHVLGFTRPGFEFAGWTRLGDVTNEIIEYVPAGFTNYDDSPVFVANWIVGIYTIRFEPDHIAFINWSESIEVSMGDAITIPELAPTNDIIQGIDVLRQGNLIFRGWRTQADGQGTLVYDGMRSNFAAHTTLYAWWVDMTNASSNVTLTIQFRTTDGNANRPFQPEMHTRLNGHTFELEPTSSYENFRFRHFRVGNEIFTLDAFTVVNGTPVLVLMMDGNLTITAYYEELYRLTLRSRIINSQGHLQSGNVFANDTMVVDVEGGTAFRFWIIDGPEGQNFDAYRGFRLSHITVNGVRIDRPASHLPQFFLVTLTYHTEILFFYTRT